MPPAVSVIMTVYNAGKYLTPAVESLLAQTFRDFELVVVENGSTDSSKELLGHYRDTRLRVVDLPRNIGRTSALIRALGEASGDLVAVQDADDVSAAGRLASQVSYMSEHADCVLLGSHARFIDASGAVVGTFTPPAAQDEVYQMMACANPIAHSAAMYRRKVAIEVGGYPPGFLFSQDYGLWLRLARCGKVANLPATLVDIRKHGGQATVAPEYLLTRSKDAILLFREASTLHGLTQESVRASRRVEAWESGRYAKALFAAGRPFSAVKWAVEGFLRDPLSFSKKSARLLRVA